MAQWCVFNEIEIKQFREMLDRRPAIENYMLGQITVPIALLLELPAPGVGVAGQRNKDARWLEMASNMFHERIGINKMLKHINRDDDIKLMLRIVRNKIVKQRTQDGNAPLSCSLSGSLAGFEPKALPARIKAV